VDLALHVDVVSGSEPSDFRPGGSSRRSDDATSRAVGFRRTARSARNYERLAQREALVASGRALVRVAVYLLVRASSLDELPRPKVTRCGARRTTPAYVFETRKGAKHSGHRAQLPWSGLVSRALGPLGDLGGPGELWRVPAHRCREPDSTGASLGQSNSTERRSCLTCFDRLRRGFVLEPQRHRGGDRSARARARSSNAVGPGVASRVSSRGGGPPKVSTETAPPPVHGVTPVALGRDGWCSPLLR